MEKDFEKPFWHGRFFRFVPLILWIGVIFFNSTTTASLSNTSRFIRPLLEFLLPNASEATYMFFQIGIRKIAHLTEYGILAFWAWWAFHRSSQKFFRENWYIASFLVVILVGSIDEFYQSLNPARTGLVLDILLDGLGGLAMIFLIWMVKKRFER